MQRRTVIDDTKQIWRSMLTFLPPLMASNILQSASSTLNSIYLGRLIGVKALAGASVFFPILFCMISFVIGIASASSVLIGHEPNRFLRAVSRHLDRDRLVDLGSAIDRAQRFDRLRAIARAGAGLNWTIGGAIITVVYLFDRSILGLFVTDANAIAIAHKRSYAVFGTSAVLSGLMRASGTVLWPTLLSVISIWGVEVPVAYALAPHFGLDGVWTAYPVAFCAGLLFQSTYYFGFWRRRRITTLLTDAPAIAS